jgi:DNA recombination protein RmuC
MLAPIVTDLLLILLLLLAALILYRSFRPSQSYASLIRLETRFDEQQKQLDKLQELLARFQTEQLETLSKQSEKITELLGAHNTGFEKRQGEAIKTLNETLQTGMTQTQKQISELLSRNIEDLGKQVNQLTEKTDNRLKEISGQVEKRLSEGFEKTTATFTDIVKRLALIDEAQKKITELSSNVVSLQEVLNDKRSRGAFGEVQLNSLISNVMPEASYALQHKLPNDKVADCVLFLPEPTGMIAIDSKFPLESYRTMTDLNQEESIRTAAEKQFKQDIQKHIKDISEKYIIPGTTSDGAVMFIPAEAVFAEIQSHYPQLVEKAHQSRVWLVSPTTLWAIMNTARAVLKDAATREQIHIIQEHLGHLSKDFGRFQKRMDNLATHIRQANVDVDDINTSAKKITTRFEKIEKVELENINPVTLPIDDNSDKS